jgi:two-component system sensor histidine kinase RegB
MQWKISNLDVGFNFRIKGKSPLPNVISDTGLTRALVNVLDNAAQASPHFVCLELDWNADNLSIVISDEGDGMAAEQLDKLGKHPMTSKEEGLGIGLYLTKATIEKLGGSIEWQNRQLNGVEVSIKLPLALKGI